MESWLVVDSGSWPGRNVLMVLSRYGTPEFVSIGFDINGLFFWVLFVEVRLEL